MKPPLLEGPWSYSRATSCPREFYMLRVLNAQPELRHERFIGIDRRKFGKLLHDASDMMLGSVVNGGGWLNATDLT